MSEHILVLGATGVTGLAFCTTALKAGHQLTLYVRNPSKLPAEISGDSKVTVIEGLLSDATGLQKAAASGAKIFVSFAGPTYGSKGTPVTDAMKLIFPLLIENHFKRALVLGTCSFTAPEDKGALKWKASVVLIKIIGGTAFQEFQGLGAFVSSQEVSQLKWTLFRVPFLGNGPEKPVHASYTGSGEDGMFLSRQSIVTWVLTELKEDSDWVGKTPVLSNW
ncbi:hypothetical protein P152DRAFT_85712 [Eremomyces bilateralis CBS 781.70]|uniref:NAD(P)-binding domain-containing protein n=1 Tax=Eremomyces bilateralis CBS 781.70 TaxID=1392243 RepID=A0A6G1FZ60_9PEZI|nr:uncharacterized protein P152DRAFT_85712 [Eremomyces bilateralis CBS 781.70]KAF1810849.1 hypothetical protein P152DRAFT_85712 [Eremomyces bilateralis CBS 781.70]